MDSNRAEQIDGRIAPILRVCDAYINFIVMVEQTFPGSVNLTVSDRIASPSDGGDVARSVYGVTLSPSDRGDVARFVYGVMQDFTNRIVRWSGRVTFESAYIMFFIAHRSSASILDLSKFSFLSIAEHVEGVFRKECEEFVLSLPSSLNFYDISFLVGLGQQLCKRFARQIDEKFRDVNNEFQDCVIALADVLLLDDKAKSQIISENLVPLLKPFQTGNKADIAEIMNGSDAILDKTLDHLITELDDLIGLDRIKQEVRSLVNLMQGRKLRLEAGLRSPNMTHHLVFSGNPGTGKTMVARLFAEICRALGVLSVRILIG